MMLTLFPGCFMGTVESERGPCWEMAPRVSDGLRGVPAPGGYCLQADGLFSHMTLQAWGHLGPPAPPLGGLSRGWLLGQQEWPRTQSQ